MKGYAIFCSYYFSTQGTGYFLFLSSLASESPPLPFEVEGADFPNLPVFK